MMPLESLPPLLRGLGTTLILMTSTLVVVAERRDAPASGTGPAPAATATSVAADADPPPHAGDAGFASLAREVRLLREQVQDNDLADEVFENPWFQWLGLLGTALIAGSFFTEWWLRRQIASAARATSPSSIEPP